MKLSQLVHDPENLSQLIKDLALTHMANNITKTQCNAVKVAVTQTLDKMSTLLEFNPTELLIWKKFINQCLLDMADLMEEGKDEGMQ